MGRIPRAVMGALALFVAGAGIAGAIDQPSIVYANQAEADEDLALFEQSHPACSLWSNWQKTCSRTGVNGAPLCQKAAKSVKPSKVFCAAQYEDDVGGPHSDDAPAEIASFFRYCKLPAGFSGTFEERRDMCSWDVNRPFNGRRLSELKHPWCQRWIKTPDRPAMDDDGWAISGAYYCAKRSIPEWCDWAEGMGIGPQLDAKSDPNAEVIPIGWGSGSQALHRTFCRRIVTDAAK